MKFQFADFDSDRSRADEPPPPPSFSGAELQAAETAAEARGRQLAGAEARASLAQRTASLVEGLLGAAQALLADQSELRRKEAERAGQLVQALAERTLPALARIGGLAEIQALAEATFAERADEPRLVLRVPDALLDPLKAALEASPALRGFSGKLIYLAEPAFVGEACRIEWADGGVEWDPARLARDLTRLAVETTGLAPAATAPAEPAQIASAARAAPAASPIPKAAPARKGAKAA